VQATGDTKSSSPLSISSLYLVGTLFVSGPPLARSLVWEQGLP
jgi:hypothetical protein